MTTTYTADQVLLQTYNQPRTTQRAPIAPVPGIVSLFFNGPPAASIANPSLVQYNTLGTVVTSVTQGKLVEGSDGILVSIPINTLAVGPTGLFTEGVNDNFLLWCRDLSNAAWTKTNCTAALTSSGADGAINSASTVTATAPNATVSQAPVGAYIACTVYLRRRIGTGTVSLSVDNGVTFLDVTAQLAPASSKAFNRVFRYGGAATTGFILKLATNGDSIDVDFAMVSTSPYLQTPILTTSAAVSRGTDGGISFQNPIPNQRGFAAFVTIRRRPPVARGGGAIGSMFLFSSGTQGAPNNWGMFLTGYGGVTAYAYNGDGSGGTQISSGTPTISQAINPGARNFGMAVTQGGYIVLYKDGVAVAQGQSGCPSIQPATIYCGYNLTLGSPCPEYGLSDIVLDYSDSFLVDGTIRPQAAWQNTKRAVCLGDSITVGGQAPDFNGSGYVDTIQQFEGTAGYQFQMGGQSGFTSVNVLNTFETIFRGQGCLRFTILCGINDLILTLRTPTDILTTLTQLINECLAEPGCERVVIGTIPPGLHYTLDPHPARQPDLVTTNTGILGFTAIDSRVKVVDVNAAVNNSGGGDASSYQPQYNAGDNLHLNILGHSVVASLFTNVLVAP